MDSPHPNRRLPAVVLAACFSMSGCQRAVVVPAEEHFLTRRVEALEKKVAELEVRMTQASSAGSGASDSGRDVLETEETKGRLMVLKIRQLETASRAELPDKIESLGFPAPELARFRRDLKLLEERRDALVTGGGAEGAAYREILEELDSARYRLELAAEGVRNRLLEESREIVQKVEAMRRQLEENASGGDPVAR